MIATPPADASPHRSDDASRLAAPPDDRAAGARPEPRRASLPRSRALDGLRGIAVAAVVVYHLDLGWLTGGFLGVSLFFTLSGFLITSLVLAERDASDAFAARRFWARRFRRLLPAAWAGLGVAILYALFAGDADQLRRLPGDVISALAYVANWHFIAVGDAYTAGYQAPSPILHYWSLAIEEQFYVLFPMLVLVLVAKRASVRTWVITIGALMVGSMISTLVLYDPEKTSNVYFGTTTRAFELLAGVALAVAMRGWWRSRDSEREDASPVARPAAVHVVGLLALAGSVALWFAVTTTTDWLYRGGLWLVALLSVGLIWSTMQNGVITRALSTRALVGLGVISYGVYVYHWPLFLWISTEHTGLTGVALVAARLGATFAVALASYYLIELPIRHGRVPLNPLTIAATVLVLLVLIGGALWAGSRADVRAVDNATAATSSAPLVTRPPVTAHAVDPTTPTTVPIAPPKRVLILGDSIVHQAYPVIEARFVAEDIETRAIGGPGQSLLAHQGAWLDELRTAIDEFDPDVVLLESCCGYGDSREPFLVDGKPAALDSEELWSAWQRVANEAIEIADRDGRAVAWVLAPPASTNGYYGPIESRIDRANTIALDLVKAHPGVEVVDWRVLAGPDGSYQESLPDANGNLVPVRAKDGLHFTDAGKAVLADVTYDALLDAWHHHANR